MKTAIFTENYYQGGLDTYIITLINNWPSKEDEFVLICNKSHEGIARYEKEINRKTEFIWHNHFHKNYFNNFISKVFRSSLLMKIVRRIITTFNLLIFLYYLIVLKRTLTKFDPDKLIVVNGGYPGGISCVAASICWGLLKKGNISVHNFHNMALPTKKYNFIANYIDSLVVNYSSYLISVSEIASQSLLERYSFRKTDKLGYIYNGVEFTEKKITKDIKKDLCINDKTKVCLILGTYEARKGHSFVFEAFKNVLKEYDDVCLICCGHGTKEEKQAVNMRIDELELNQKVYVLDFRRDIHNLFAATDILLIGSQEYESFGLTSVEAMFRKKVIVSTNTGGLKEVIKNNEGGFTFDKDDVEGYAHKIKELLLNDQLRIEQGIKGEKRAKMNFTPKKMTDQYYRILNK